MNTNILFIDPDFFSENTKAKFLRQRREIMSVILIVSDILSISISILVAINFWRQIRPDLQVDAHLFLIPPLAVFFILTYQLVSLYPGVGIGPVEELRKLTTSSSFLIISVIALSFFLHTEAVYSRATLLISWIFIILSVPLSRKIFRRLAVKFGIWGIPVAIAGETAGVTRIQNRLLLHPLSGLWPVICFTDFLQANGCQPSLSKVDTLILVAGPENFIDIQYFLTHKAMQFKRTILILDETKIGPIWFTPFNIVEHLGLEVTNNLISSRQPLIKAIMEIGIIFLFTPLIIFLFVFIALAIKISSPGPVFFKHKRIGHNGNSIWIWKFRTMVVDAERELEYHLQSNSEFQKEWSESFKLKNDPRVTKIGRLLRRTSLDELPQIWNVLTREMNLIGPRPIVEEEIPLYKDFFELYKHFIPGITGLWQISGRNDLPYDERVALDVYYIQTWSIWLDIHILFHTFLTVVEAQGAY